MISEKENIRISKFLNLLLRHQPETTGIELNENGWVSVSELLDKLKAKGFAIDLETLQYVVATNTKKRFAFSEDETRIRAS